MIEQIVSLLTGILKELTALRVSYDAALAGVRGDIAAAGQAAEKHAAEKQVKAADPGKQTVPVKEQASAPNPFQTAAPAAAAATASAPVGPANTVQVTREQCGLALVELATSKNREAAVAALAKFNATLVKEVKEADLLPFYAAIQEALK